MDHRRLAATVRMAVWGDGGRDAAGGGDFASVAEALAAFGMREG